MLVFFFFCVIKRYYNDIYIYWNVMTVMILEYLWRVTKTGGNYVIAIL